MGVYDTLRRIAFALLFAALTSNARAGAFCPYEQDAEQIPTTQAELQRCEQLDPIVRKPTPDQLDQYEAHLSEFFNLFCHRRLDKGWVRDQTVRDTGPFVAALKDGSWTGAALGTHAPVLIWYSPEMIAWLRANRPDGGAAAPADPPPIPDGAIMVKEMYGAYKVAEDKSVSIPASACRIADLLRLRPTESGAAIMVRDNAAAKDGWFWGWYGWPKTPGAPNTAWSVDWPPPSGNPLPTMGFGQYCANCHASASNNMTFASLSNVQGGKAVRYLPFLSQDAFMTQRFGGSEQGSGTPSLVVETRHNRPLGQIYVGPLLARLTPPPMRSQTYDNVWMPGQATSQHGEFVTSDQCVGCHTAGGTGLSFDMTDPAPPDGAYRRDKTDPPPILYNFSPYGTWRTSPMGLSGRDPIFFAQLSSETKTFHPAAAAGVENTCLGCHGIQGQRQFHIAPDPESVAFEASNGACAAAFRRDVLDETPYPSGPGQSKHFDLAALARDGVSCTACHHMALGKDDGLPSAPQNRCIVEQQRAANQDGRGKLFTGFAATFTGNFFVGPQDRMYGPYEKPLPASMRHALGVTPEHDAAIQSSEMCGTCHTLHVSVMVDGKTIGRAYEQTTYPEWAFSDYRLGATPYGALPFGKGSLAASCQDCHMPKAANGEPFRSKIAGIQEHDNFPAVENALPGADIDLPTRSGFAKHTLVGLNVFLMEMAAQYPNILGIPQIDPMLGKKGVRPTDLTEQAMLDQAAHSTADIALAGLRLDGDALLATVTVSNKSGHKFPSGVGFRRAFVDFAVMDADDVPLWESGRTDKNGVLVDEAGKPIDGETWWTENCGAPVNSPGHNHYQPHYREINRQDQAQVFQELITAPPAGDHPICGPGAKANDGALTTSFLSICARLKDNRLLPRGFLPEPQRREIALALGADAELADDVGSVGVSDDPAYATVDAAASGSDAFTYRVPVAALNGKQPAKVSATLYYQAAPPFYLMDRFCTAGGVDLQRLKWLTEELKLTDRIANWKLEMVTTGKVPLPPR